MNRNTIIAVVVVALVVVGGVYFLIGGKGTAGSQNPYQATQGSQSPSTNQLSDQATNQLDQQLQQDTAGTSDQEVNNALTGP